MSFLKLRLSAMANGGQALGRDTNNRVIFVPQAIPGELVEVEVDEQTKGHSQAQLRRVLQPSAERVSARATISPTKPVAISNTSPTPPNCTTKNRSSSTK